jgi:hypothetical protein
MRGPALESLVWEITDAVCPGPSFHWRTSCGSLGGHGGIEMMKRSELRDVVSKAVDEWAGRWTEELQAVSHVSQYAAERAAESHIVDYRVREDEATLRSLANMIAKEGRERGVVSFVDHGLVYLGPSKGAARAYSTEMGITLLRVREK